MISRYRFFPVFFFSPQYCFQISPWCFLACNYTVLQRFAQGTSITFTSFPQRWTPRLTPTLCYSNSAAVNISTSLPACGFCLTYTQEWNCWVIRYKHPSFRKVCQSAFQTAQYQLTLAAVAPYPSSAWSCICNLSDLKGHLPADLSCLSVIPGELEHLFMYLWVIQVSSSGNWLFISFAHFSTGLPLFLWICRSSLCI